MLRKLVLALGVLLVLAGLIATLGAQSGAGLVCLIWGGLIVIGILFERYVYKPVVATAPSGPGWERTDERFVDEKTGKIITVYVKAKTGERVYVAEPAPGGETGTVS